jgi:transposase-like protein
MPQQLERSPEKMRHQIGISMSARMGDGFVCSGCGGRAAWQLKARPRVYECAACHRQESVTAGTVFHRTRTDLSKWFLAAYLMGRDKRGVSAKFLQRELAVAYQTAWTMAHKLRHGLSEDPARPLRGFLEAAEGIVGFYNHRGTCEKHIKEGENAIKWTRLSCRTFAANVMRMKARQCIPALCGGQSDDLDASVVSLQTNFVAAHLNGMENCPQDARESGECRLTSS